VPLVRIDMFRNGSTRYRLAIRDAVCEAWGDVMDVSAEECHGVVIDHEADNQLNRHVGVQHNSDAISVTIAFDEEVGIDQKGLLYTAIVRALRQRIGLADNEVTLKLVKIGDQGSVGDIWVWMRSQDESGR
jgi:hypothetical protein